MLKRNHVKEHCTTGGLFYVWLCRVTTTMVTIWRWYVPSCVRVSILMLYNARKEEKELLYIVKMLGKLTSTRLQSTLVFTFSPCHTLFTVKRSKPPVFTLETRLIYQIMPYYSLVAT